MSSINTKESKKKKDSNSDTTEWMLMDAKKVISVRNRDREFHGLESEFMLQQEDILQEYEKSKILKHPRDCGNAREEILRKFLQKSGYIPQKYGISEKSARIISPSGHSSNEIDILIYDKDNSISLMKRNEVFVVYPIDCVYGVIQVKSKLTKIEIKKGLENISSFKRLHAMCGNSSSGVGGFGILFAYDSDMEWGDIINEVKVYAASTNQSSWCNLICILKKGCIFHGSDKASFSRNQDIEKISDLKMYGMPDRTNQTLYIFYSILITLLRDTKTQPVDVHNYFKLPFVAGSYSYTFTLGNEIHSCEKHGAIQKKISEDNLKKIITQIKISEPINAVKATEIACGYKGNNYEQYKRQPMEVRIYNPESLSLPEILMIDHTVEGGKIKVTAFESIDCLNMRIWIPHYYIFKESLLEHCPKCIAFYTRKNRLSSNLSVSRRHKDIKK